jgi:hypothetical protein
MLKLNGYDERFSEGCWYGDDYLLHRVRLMGLQVETTAAPFVVHQWHNYNSLPANHAELIEKNRVLFIELINTYDFRAKHIFTNDLAMKI